MCFYNGQVSFYETDPPTDKCHLWEKHKDQPHEDTGEQTKQADSEGKLAFGQKE